MILLIAGCIGLALDLYWPDKSWHRTSVCANIALIGIGLLEVAGVM